MVDLIPVAAWTVAILASVSGIAALVVSHLERPRLLPPRPRYRRTGTR